MKILYSCLSKSWGGMEMYTLTAMKQLLKRGIEVHLLCFKGSTLNKEAIGQGCKVYTSTASSYFHPGEISMLAKLLRKEKFDLIHTHASKDLWLLTPAMKLSGRKLPLFLTKHVGSYIAKKDMLHRWIYSSVTRAFAISNVIKKNLLDTCPLTEDKIVLLHDGIDMKKFHPGAANASEVRAELGIKPEEIVLGMSARLSAGKGHEEYLQALAGLRQEFPLCRGIIVGEASYGEESYAAKIKALAGELKLDNVLFVGYRKDTVRMYAAMDIFVFPSHSEAFGMALVEAMAMGKPSVCTNSDGVPDIAVANETSFLFIKQNAKDLEDKLRVLMRSKELQNRFSLNAAARARKLFDLEILTDRVIDLYKENLLP